MKRLVVAMVALAFSWSPAAGEERSLRIAATEFPPYYGTELENHGFLSEIIAESFGRAGYGIDVSFLPWKRAMAGAKAGKYDGLYSVWRRPEREEWFVFSDPLPANELGFYKRNGKDIRFDGFASLKPYMIGIVRGYALPPGFEEAGLKTSLANDDEQNLRKLHKGHVDLALIDRIMAAYIVKTKIPEAVSDLGWLDPPVHVDIQYLVMSKQAPDHVEVLRAFNAGLADMTADGTLQAIMARHGF